MSKTRLTLLLAVTLAIGATFGAVATGYGSQQRGAARPRTAVSDSVHYFLLEIGAGGFDNETSLQRIFTTISQLDLKYVGQTGNKIIVERPPFR